ncbi:MAG TPA: PAS domain S-box protein [Nitrospiraceae bacterium]|nr:PAS domain S-box protein [Nitrospiraceae bacterium]
MNMDTIPASTDGQQSQHHPAAMAPAYAFHGGPINILIVDDDPKNLTVLETVLDNPGYRLVRAGSADQALLALVEEEFALLILDIRMPGMTGFELAQLIKERKKTSRVPIIFLTAYYNEDQHVLEGYGTGAVDYLHKPVNPAILRSKVAVFAELHSKSRALRAEVTEHRQTAEQLRELNETLEQRVTERTEALRLSEERYRMLFETAPMALFVCDRNAVIQHYNRRAVELWGREPICGVEQHCGSVKLWLPDHTLLPHALSPMVEVLRTGIPATNIEVSIERPDGSCVPVLVNFAALKGAQGEITGAITSFIDIAERKRVEEALSRSERNLSDFFDNASVGLHWVGPDGIILKVNQTELDLLGYNREEYVGRHIAEFHVDQPVIQDILERLAGGETLRECPARIRCKDGSILDVLINSNVLFEDGKFIHTRCFTRDITDRKRAEEALRENEERFRTLADNVSQFAWTADPTGWIFWYNRRWYEYTGTTFEEMQGWGWEKVHHPDHLDRVAEKWRQALAIGEPWEDTFPLRGLDGTYRWFLSRALPIRDAEGRIVRWFGTNTDINELRETQATLRESEGRLREQGLALAETNKELEGFSYSVSHDLRAPLRTIDAFSRILEEDHGAHLNAEAHRCLTIVRKAAAQAGELIDDLLEFSRLGRQGMNFSSVEMADLAREAADALMTMHDGRQIDLIIGDLPSCQGDRRLLKLVWTNLLMNAFKYTKYRNEAKIEVGWMPNDASAEAVTYYIKDNGVGFDMKYVHKLFGVFQRLHQKEDFDGTGVGLAIVQRIVQRHGGRIWGEGKVDSGATFSFSVPKATA